MSCVWILFWKCRADKEENHSRVDVAIEIVDEERGSGSTPDVRVDGDEGRDHIDKKDENALVEPEPESEPSILGSRGT